MLTLAVSILTYAKRSVRARDTLIKSNPLRRAQPVAPYPFGVQNTTRLLRFGLPKPTVPYGKITRPFTFGTVC